VLYSGYLIQAAGLAGVFVNQLRQGKPMAQALPPGYGLSLIGASIFAVGGVAIGSGINLAQSGYPSTISLRQTTPTSPKPSTSPVFCFTRPC
jgi:hypothetical protein